MLKLNNNCVKICKNIPIGLFLSRQAIQFYMKKSEKTRQAIIEKAAALFNQQGYAGTSMSHIQAAVGLTKGALYGHFDSKEAISIAAFEYSVLFTNEAIRKRTRIIDHSLDKLKAVVYFYKERMFDPPIEGGCPILNTSIEADDNNPVLKEKVIEAIDLWTERIIHTVKKGIQKGEIREDVDPKEFATLFIGILEGGIMMARLKKDLSIFNIMAKQLIRNIEGIQDRS